METKRLFIAIKPPQDFIQSLITYQKDYLNYPCFRQLNEEFLHLTLIFLGSIKKEDISKIIDALKTISKKYHPFLITFKKFDYGPIQKSPRLVWLEGETPKELLLLKEDLEKELEKNKISFKKEERDFKAHITVSRIKKDFSKYLPPSEQIKKEVKLEFLADSLILMESKLHPTGARYYQIETFNLNKDK